MCTRNFTGGGAILALFLLPFAVGCGSESAGTAGGPSDAGPEAGTLGDASGDKDAGAAPDASSPTDAGPAVDSASPIDSAGVVDAGAKDTASPVDAGPIDAGPIDAGPIDAGPFDAGSAKDAGPSGCTQEQSCSGGQMCFAPGDSIGCGMCKKPTNTCKNDSDCTSSGQPMICLYKKTDCTCSGDKLCHKGCVADSDCTGFAEVCGSDHHCKPAPCSMDADCPTLGACFGQAGIKGCVRKPCKASGECGSGYCVKGACYPTPGFCSMLPP